MTPAEQRGLKPEAHRRTNLQMARTVDDFAPKIPSGIDAIDREWGGLYAGGTYLVYGRVSNGRGLVALLYSQIGAALDEKTLYLSGERSKDLIIQAASIGFDIRRAHRLGVFKLVRTSQLLRPHPDRSAENFSPFERLLSQIRSYSPARLVVSDAMAFAGNSDPLSLEFRDSYATFLEQIEALGTTLMITLPEPANEVARRFTEFVMSLSTAAIYVGREEDEEEASERYQITLIPQIGHITRKKSIRWNLVDLVERAERIDSTYRALQGRIAAAGGAFLLPEATVHDRPSVDVSNVDARVPGPRPTEPEVHPAERTTPVTTVEVETTDEHVVPHKTLEDLAVDSLETPSTPSLIDRVLDDVLRSREVHKGAAEAPAAEVVVERKTDQENVVGRQALTRSDFTVQLQSFFDSAAEHKTDFLIVAMRVDRDGVSPHEFSVLSDTVSGAIRDKDALFTDPRKGRLVLLMPESSADQAQELFAEVKKRLRREGAVGADSVLRKVSAIVVPNGNPFSGATEFLNYVLDNE